MLGKVIAFSAALSWITVGITALDSLGVARASTNAPAAATNVDCTEYTEEWEADSPPVAFESRTCEYTRDKDKFVGRFHNKSSRAIKIEGRVWTSEPQSCTRGGTEVMFFYQTIPAYGYSGTDFTIQPPRTRFWVCAREVQY